MKQKTSYLQYLIENQQQPMKKYKLLKDLPDCKAGAIFVSNDSLSNPRYVTKLQPSSYYELHDSTWITNRDWFEPIEDNVDWRKYYEVSKNGLIANRIMQEFYPKLQAYLKILCYVEAANKGKELKNKYYEVAVDGANRLDVCEYTMTCTNGLVVLTDKADAEAMLEDPELVKALEIVYNVGK